MHFVIVHVIKYLNIKKGIIPKQYICRISLKLKQYQKQRNTYISYIINKTPKKRYSKTIEENQNSMIFLLIVVPIQKQQGKRHYQQEKQ